MTKKEHDFNCKLLLRMILGDEIPSAMIFAQDENMVEDYNRILREFHLDAYCI